MSKQQSGIASDTTYNLISLTYHALQAADTYHMYRRDAEQAGDTELAQLVQQATDQQREIASQAKTLLAQRLAQGGDS